MLTAGIENLSTIYDWRVQEIVCVLGHPLNPHLPHCSYPHILLIIQCPQPNIVEPNRIFNARPISKLPTPK
jgi:hypothetical protein